MSSRREFIKCAGAGLVLGLMPAHEVFAEAQSEVLGAVAFAASTPFAQPFLIVDDDDTVTVVCKHLDMGQGIWTGLASIVAEELDASWSQVRVVGAPADQAIYKNLLYGFQGTGGSTSIKNSWDQMRSAGAVARAMLVRAAADRWKVPVQHIRVVDGVVSCETGGRVRRARFGQLAAAASRVDVPTDVKPKDAAHYRFIGKRFPRLDSKEKSTGRTLYGIDVKRPGMKIAMVVRAPRFGATLMSFDDREARAMKGVVDVVAIPSGVAVIADDTWVAMQARARVTVRWDESNAERRSTSQLFAEYRRVAGGEASNVCVANGDSAKALAAAVRIVDADFEFPYLAHASMEPLCAAGEIGTGPAGRHCTIWAAIQNHTVDHRNVAKILDLTLADVTLNTLYAGGSFGRRATWTSDWIGELAHILKATGGRYPVKVFRTREDDIGGGFYRPMVYHRIKAGLDANGDVAGFHQNIVAQSFFFGFKGKVDPTAVDGTAVARYDLPDATLDWVNAPSGVTVVTFRALSYNHTTISKEIFMNDLARAAGRDPLAFREQYLAKQPRQLAVLRLAASEAGWSEPRKEGRALGLAVTEAQDTFVALVAEVAIVEGKISVGRVVCAVDCGYALNPDVVRSQMEGGIGFGLSNALAERITLADGRVEQSNFHDYAVLRIDRMPTSIDVHIVDSGHPPSGVGEPGSVLIAAAVANAYTALTGKPVRRFPLSDLEG